MTRVYGLNNIFDESGIKFYEKTSAGWGSDVSLIQYQNLYKYFVFTNLYTSGYGYKVNQ